MRNRVILAVAFFWLAAAPSARAICAGVVFNPVTDVCWECMFPIKLMGVPVLNLSVSTDGFSYSGDDTPADPASGQIACVCPMPLPLPPQPGLSTSFWEPAHIIETTSDPFCLPTLGTGLGYPFSAAHGSTAVDRAGSSDIDTFAQVHLYYFPIDQILSGFTSGACAIMGAETAGLFDIGYISEPDPTHSDDALANILNPESLLFANPVAQMSCIADSVAANAGAPLDPMFWCMGSWGSTYPLDGRTADSRAVSASAAIAAKNIYKRARMLSLFDPAVDPTLCLALPTPTWVKSHYRLQPAKPVRGYMCTPIGRSSLIWGVGMNPAFAGDNFAWVEFRKKACCAW